jgi:hypothetical protein
MDANKYNNPLLEEFDERLTEFERKIKEDDYAPSDDGFENGYYQLKEDCQDLYSECYDENDEKLVDDFIKRLNVIRDDHGLYNKKDELDRMFPDRTDKSDPDGEWESGFSADKFLGLDD